LSKEDRAKNQEPRAKNKEQRAKNQEPRDKSIMERAFSSLILEIRAESCGVHFFTKRRIEEK